MRVLTTTALAGGVAAAAVLGLGAAPASADHVHFRVLGNGDCVLLAPDGGEKHVQLPNADGFADNRKHPLHVKVHLGTPGSVGEIYVAYPASGVLNPEAVELCGGEFVNG
ncbi:hypothetical protein [Aquipuribacter nitratireducens]|uniref:Uncharacterized protein n=1 Tax=Aquipuribacter nitratireducens TaxID=650104 RepID=A0ABW0GLM2_9MICO